MHFVDDITGNTFGQWKALEYAGTNAKQTRMWRCICSCGTERLVKGIDLRHGRTKKCIRCRNRSNPTKHGHTSNKQWSGAFRSWLAMRARCEKPTDVNYRNYGGRGIRVCERWQSFEAFVEDMGDRPKGRTIDRMDVNGDYEPSNCRWATRLEQGFGRRDNQWLTHDGRTQRLIDWARELGLLPSSLCCRIRRGWPLEKALSTPKGAA